MPSHFGWVDFANEDRQRMLDVVQLFREQDTRDELGIGTIRDAFADYFFPGTSTIQTRARYMLFVPWIYLGLERKRVPSASNSRASGQNHLIPFWIFEVQDGYKVYRYIPALPLSRERERLGDLRRTLVAYRIVFGQPRQEDLVNYLQSRSEGDLDLEELLRHRIDLSPKSQSRSDI